MSISLAIGGLLLTGLSWCLIGIVMSDAEKYRCDTNLVMILTYVSTAVISAFLLKLPVNVIEAPAKVVLWVSICDFVAFLFNYGMQYTMSLAMKNGPNGIVWGIVQSATMFPFLVGVLFLGDHSTWARWLGIFSLLMALFMFAVAKSDKAAADKKEASEGKFGWRFWVFLSFAFTAIQQSLSTLPSYFSSVVDGIPICYRMMIAGCSGLVAGLFLIFLQSGKSAVTQVLHKQLLYWKLWLLVIVMLLPVFVAELCFMYPALNYLASLGMGGIGYPLMVGSCVVFFTIISWLYYKEKFSIMQLGAVLVCLLGLCLMCL